MSPPDVRRVRPGQETDLDFANPNLSAGRRCLVCHYPLTAALSVERGIGPVCAKRVLTAPVLESPAVDVVVVKLCARCLREAAS